MANPINVVDGSDIQVEIDAVTKRAISIRQKVGSAFDTPLATYATDASGNVTGLVGPSGRKYRANRIAGNPSGMIKVNTNSTLNAAVTVATTYDTEQAALGPFVGIKLLYCNYDASFTMPITKAKVAASPSHGYNTGGNNASTLTWSNVTFNGGSLSATLAAASAGSTTSQNNPTSILSDFIALPSIARTDKYDGVNVYTNPLLRVLTLITPVTSFSSVSDNSSYASWNVSGNNNLPNSLVTARNATAGDFVTNPAANTNGIFDIYGGAVIPTGFIFYYANQVNITCLCVGDSLTSGIGSGLGGIGGFPQRAFTSLFGKLGIYGNFLNFGTSGQRLNESQPVARSLINTIQPEYLAIFADSPNGNASTAPATQAVFDAMYADFLNTVDVAKSKGVTVIAFTSPMYSGGTWALIDAQNKRLLNMAGQIKVVDLAAVFSPNGVESSQYYNADTTHFTDLGYATAADLLTSAISSDFM